MKKRILVYGLCYSCWGGTEEVVNSFMKSMNTNFKFDIIYTSEPFYLEKLKHSEIDLKYIPRFCKPIERFNEIKKILSNNYDYVWIHKNKIVPADLLFLYIVKKYSNAKVIVHSHSSGIIVSSYFKNTFLKLTHYIGRKYFVKNADFLWACSQRASDWLYGKRVNSQIINNGIKVENFKFNREIREEYREKMNLQNKFVLFTVGRLAKVKNQIFLLNVMSELLKVRNDVVLLIAGTGPLELKLKQQAKELDLDKDTVKFLGFRDDVPSLLHAVDAFCLPSFFEGLPIVLIEAQTSGLPCFVSNKVSDESDVSGNIQFLSIDTEVKPWVEALLEFKSKDRNNSYLIVRNHGYDIYDVAKNIERELES